MIDSRFTRCTRAYLPLLLYGHAFPDGSQFWFSSRLRFTYRFAHAFATTTVPTFTLPGRGLSDVLLPCPMARTGTTPQLPHTARFVRAAALRHFTAVCVPLPDATVVARARFSVVTRACHALPMGLRICSGSRQHRGYTTLRRLPCYQFGSQCPLVLRSRIHPFVKCADILRLRTITVGIPAVDYDYHYAHIAGLLLQP